MRAHLIVATWYKFQLTRQLGGSRQQNMPTPVKIMLRGSCLSMYNEHTLMRWEQQRILWLAFMSASNKWCNKQQHSIFQTTQISNYILYRGLSRECTPEEYWTWLCSILQRECTPLNSGPTSTSLHMQCWSDTCVRDCWNSSICIWQVTYLKGLAHSSNWSPLAASHSTCNVGLIIKLCKMLLECRYPVWTLRLAERERESVLSAHLKLRQQLLIAHAAMWADMQETVWFQYPRWLSDFQWYLLT